MEIEKRHANIFLQALAVKTKNEAQDLSIRSVSTIARLTERECELAVSLLLQDGFLSKPRSIIAPDTQLKISKKGVNYINNLNSDHGFDFGSLLAVKYQLEQVKKDEKEQRVIKEEEKKKAFETHNWQQIGSYASGAGEITKDKWYPMGSYCRKCGMNTQTFKRNPIACPK